MKNGSRSNVRGWLAAAALCGLSLNAGAAWQAAYPPPAVTGSPLGDLLVKPSAINGILSGTGEAATIRTGAGVGARVAGQTLPIAFRVPGAAATVARAMFLNPATLAVGAVAWAAAECVEYQGGKWVLTCGSLPGQTPPVVSTGREFQAADVTLGWFPTADAAIAAHAASLIGKTNSSFQGPITYAWVNSSSLAAGGPDKNYRLGFQGAHVDPPHGLRVIVDSIDRKTTSRVKAGCPSGWFILADGSCVQTAPKPELTQEQMANALASKNLPSITGVDWTGWGDPTFNVSKTGVTLNPSASNPPQAQPQVVPLGNPQPVPNTDPQRYKQPIVTLTPSPTATDPWRVDVVPGEREGDSPTGLQEPESTTEPPTGDTPKEETDVTQCDKYPDTLGCAELDVPDGEIPKDEIQITYSAETPFGGGSCPADKNFASALAGRSFKAVDWVQWCSYAPIIRTLVILLATISAFFIVSLGKDAE